MSIPPANLDYADLYDGYWRHPGRLGEASRQDPPAVVAELLDTLGTGRILDVGCGAGRVVCAMLAHGVDAHGLDVSAVAVDHGNRLAPGRFHLGSVLGLPFPDEHFDAVVVTECLEHLDESHVSQALSELHRVTKRGVYLRVATVADREGRWHRTVQQRSWWEDRLFAAGFRKHPRAMAVVPYKSLEHDGDEIMLVQERLPPAALREHAIERLIESRDLHMDMLRETGRRSDAHVVRYHLAAGFVRPHDVVLDVACGLGYGSAVLAANTEAERVLGVDLDEYAVRYATAMTSANWPQVSFRAADATSLSFLSDQSVDLITSFETLEHVPDPEALLAEFHRVLKPSGRILVSVPHLWVDETGRDPNPHHLHVYDWPKLHGQIAQNFVAETVWGQTAGGGLKLTDAPRRIVRAALADPTGTPAEWWLLLAMKTPIDADRAGYEETSFPPLAGSERPHVTAFGRDYENPWLVKAMVVRGHRVGDDGLLQRLAEQVLDRHEVSDGSADVGAALCVLAYLVLAEATAPADRIDRVLARIDRCCEATSRNPTALRWQISLHYVAACLLRKCGRREQAAMRFRRCAEMDAAAYSAILGTKTVDALLQAGLLAVADGDENAARRDWQQALQECERLLQADWSSFVGDRARPLAFGLREATDLVDLTARTARGLLDLSSMRHRPGKSWDLLRFGLRPKIELLERVLEDSREWSASLLDMLTAAQQTIEQERERAEQISQQHLDEASRGREQLTAQLTAQAAAQAAEVAAKLAAAQAAEVAAEVAAKLAAARSTIEEQERQIASLQRMRGIKGTLRGLVDRLRN